MKGLDLRVGPGDGGLRLDQFIARAGGVSRGAARRALEAGGVFLDGRRIKIASRAVRAGQRVQVVFEESGREAPREDEPLESARVLYQDADVVVVDKPAGVPAQATRASDRGTLPGRVAALLRPSTPRPPRGRSAQDERIVFPVHRLDLGTTGACALALSQAAQRRLMRAFREGLVEKEYLALVAGHAPERADVDRPLGRDPARPGLMRVASQGAPARTRVELRERLRGASLVACFPETGRTHQIRVHLASLGHPLLGDPRYGGPGEIEGALVERPMLHASRLVLPGPIEVRAPLPEDFVQLHGRLLDRH